MEWFWKWLRRKLSLDLLETLRPWLANELEFDRRKLQALQSAADDFHQRLADMNQLLKQACNGVQAAATSLDAGIRELPQHVPFSWREYHAVNYAVSKLENDPEYLTRTTQAEQLSEAIRWAWRYCEHRKWSLISSERLATLIKTRRELAEPTVETFSAVSKHVPHIPKSALERAGRAEETR